MLLRDLQTLTLAHIYPNLHSASFVQSLRLKPSTAMAVQGNQDETPVWKIWRVVSRRKGGERVRWAAETGDGHRLPPAHCCTIFSLMGTQSPHRTPELASPIPNFLPSFRYFPHIFFAKKVRGPILLTIDSMQLAVTLHGSETIVSR